MLSRDLRDDVMEMLTRSSGHLPCVSGGKEAGASSRIHQGSSCVIDQKQNSSGSFQQGSPGTSCWSPVKVNLSRHAHCRVTCGAEERRRVTCGTSV